MEKHCLNTNMKLYVSKMKSDFLGNQGHWHSHSSFLVLFSPRQTPANTRSLRRREVQAWRVCTCMLRVPGFPGEQKLCCVTAKAAKFCSLVWAVQLMLLALKGSGVPVKGLATALSRCLTIIITEPRSPNHFTSTHTPAAHSASKSIIFHPTTQPDCP